MRASREEALRAGAAERRLVRQLPEAQEMPQGRGLRVERRRRRPPGARPVPGRARRGLRAWLRNSNVCPPRIT